MASCLRSLWCYGEQFILLRSRPLRRAHRASPSARSSVRPDCSKVVYARFIHYLVRVTRPCTATPKYTELAQAMSDSRAPGEARGGNTNESQMTFPRRNPLLVDLARLSLVLIRLERGMCGM